MIAKDLIPEVGTRSFAIMKCLLKSHARKSHPPLQAHFPAFRVPCRIAAVPAAPPPPAPATSSDTRDTWDSRGPWDPGGRQMGIGQGELIFWAGEMITEESAIESPKPPRSIRSNCFTSRPAAPLSH
jgi:hypothetical protein